MSDAPRDVEDEAIVAAREACDRAPVVEFLNAIGYRKIAEYVDELPRGAGDEAERLKLAKFYNEYHADRAIGVFVDEARERNRAKHGIPDNIARNVLHWGRRDVIDLARSLRPKTH